MPEFELFDRFVGVLVFALDDAKDVFGVGKRVDGGSGKPLFGYDACTLFNHGDMVARAETGEVCGSSDKYNRGEENVSGLLVQTGLHPFEGLLRQEQ